MLFIFILDMLMLYWKLELGGRKVESRGWWRWGGREWTVSTHMGLWEVCLAQTRKEPDPKPYRPMR